jgi:hypothetical protein
MSTPADTTTPPASAPAAPAGNASPAAEETDPTLRLLFDAAESEKPDPSASTDVLVGKSLIQTIDEPAGEPPPAPPKPEDKKPAADAPPKPEDKPIKIRRTAKQEPPAPPPPPPAPKDEPRPKEKSEYEKFEETLIDEERDQLDVARFAESKDPGKYKGLASRTLTFLKAHQEYLEKNPQATEPDSEAAEKYQEWLGKNTITLPPREMRMLEREMIAEVTREKVAKETDSKLSEIHDENFRRDKEPEIRREVDDFFNKTAQAAIPPEFAAMAREKGIEEAKKAFPTEFRVASEVLTETAGEVEEFRRLTTINPRTGRPLAAYDPNSPKHAKIVAFIREQCDWFKNGVPGENEDQRTARVRAQNQGGKQFLTRDEYYSMSIDQRGPYWTFTPEQVVAMQTEVAKRRISDRVKQEYSMRESEGWVRRPAQSAAPEQRPAGAPPAPRPSPMPGGSPAPELPDRTFELLVGGAL